MSETYLLNIIQPLTKIQNELNNLLNNLISDTNKPIKQTIKPIKGYSLKDTQKFYDFFIKDIYKTSKKHKLITNKEIAVFELIFNTFLKNVPLSNKKNVVLYNKNKIIDFFKNNINIKNELKYFKNLKNKVQKIFDIFLDYSKPYLRDNINIDGVIDYFDSLEAITSVLAD